MKKKKTLLFALILIAVTNALIFYKFLTTADRTDVIFLGDSLFAAHMSYDVISDIENTQPHLKFKTFAENAALTSNLFPYLQQVKNLTPKKIFILIGTNDVIASFGPEHRKIYEERKGLTYVPSLETFRANYENILKQFFAMKSVPEIILFELPILGENLESAENRRIKEFNKVIRELSHHYQLPLIETFKILSEKLPTYDKEDRCKNLESFTLRTLFVTWPLKGFDWDKVSDHYGFTFSTDCIHLNKRAWDLVLPEILKELR